MQPVAGGEDVIVTGGFGRRHVEGPHREGRRQKASAPHDWR
jgi:hypothetical protein